jgi:hypothetical protein
VLGIVGGTALLVQLSIWLAGSGGTVAGVLRTLVAFFSFFTNMVNAAVAVAAVRLAWRFDGPFARPRLATALAVYATVVCGVYEIVLRRLWNPRGLTLVLDTVFHDLVPLAYVVLWAVCIPKGTLRWRDALPWLIGPAVYGAWIAVLGVAGGGSPYPFLNVASLGLGRVAAVVIGLLGLFWVVGLGFIAFDRSWHGRQHGVR